MCTTKVQGFLLNKKGERFDFGAEFGVIGCD